MPESAISPITIRRRDGTLVAGSRDLVQPDTDVIVYPSQDGAGPLGELGPNFTLCHSVPWEDGTLHIALASDWHVFPAPSASGSSSSGALYLAVRKRNGDEQLLQYLPPLVTTSCHLHRRTTEVIAAVAGVCNAHRISPSGEVGVDRIVPAGTRFAIGNGHILWTPESPAVNIITMYGPSILRTLGDTLDMDMSDHIPVEPPASVPTTRLP